MSSSPSGGRGLVGVIAVTLRCPVRPYANYELLGFHFTTITGDQQQYGVMLMFATSCSLCKAYGTPADLYACNEATTTLTTKLYPKQRQFASIRAN